MEQKCAFEKQILKNTLSLSNIASDEMAFHIMKTSGYTSVMAGEVIHLIKYIPVDCRVRYRMSQWIASDIPEPILLPRTKIQNINQNRHSKRLQWTLPHHVQDSRFLVSVDVKISGDNIHPKYNHLHVLYGNM